ADLVSQPHRKELEQNIGVINGQHYPTFFTLKNYSNGGEGVEIKLGGASGTKRAANGNWIEVITAGGSPAGMLQLDPTFRQPAFSIDNVHCICLDDFPLTGIFNDADGYPNTDQHDDPNGQIDGALLFDGINDYVRCEDNDSLDITGNLTISAWVQRPSAGSSDEVIVSKYNGGDYSYRLLFLDTNYVRWWLSQDGTPGNSAYVDSTLTITDTGWHFIVATFESGTLKIYIDGVDKTGSSTGSITSINTTTEPLFIGQENSNNYFEGKIDDVMIFDRALTAEEI
ncbi:unnamed protein product, partial [marine sediment metagenome]